MELDCNGREETMLRDSARRALANAIDRERLCRDEALDQASLDRAWSVAVDMGWTGILVPSECGGLGLGVAEASVICEEMGRALFPGPFTATAILAAALISRWPATPDRNEALSSLAAGTMRIGMAGLAEIANARGRAPLSDRGIRRDLVEFPEAATHYLIVRGNAEAADGTPFQTLLLPVASGSATITRRQPLDPTCPIATVEIVDIPNLGLLQGEIAAEEMGRLAAIGHVAGASELVGIAGAALDMAVAYAKERSQFGVPIGSFQAIKHRLVDCFVLLENARSATQHAAIECDAGGADCTLAVDAARSAAIDAALRITADCIQIHGALGFSSEHAAHLYLKRARRLAAGLGGSSAARRAIGARLAELALRAQDELFSSSSAAATPA